MSAEAGFADLGVRALSAELFTIDPWPFRAPRLEVHCEGRRLPSRVASEAELHARLDAAPAVRLTFTLLPGEPGPERQSGPPKRAAV